MPEALVAHADLAEHVAPAVAANPDCAVLVVGDGYEDAIAAAPATTHRSTSSASARRSSTPRARRVGPRVWCTRPSSTWRPRVSMMEGQVALWGWTSDDVYILSGPAYHAGPGGWTMAALYVGAPTVVLPSFDAREWLRLVDRHRVTCSFMVPAHFIRILEVPEAERAAFDLPSLRILVHAGAPCPVTVKRRIIDALAPCEIVGAVRRERGRCARGSRWRSGSSGPGSVGTPWPGVEVRILDEDGSSVPTGETGIVYVRPPGGAGFHYHDDPDKTASAWRDDAFTVGDVGHLDADGYLYLTDRASDMVIRGGVNIYPREIEEVLYQHPSVVDCAVFGVPDERLGEQLHAVVEVRDATDIGELRGHCSSHLADFKVPATFELVDELPRQPNGKVLKRLLRDRHWAGRDTNI